MQPELSSAISQAHQLARLKIAQRCQTDLFYLARYILNYDLMTDGTHAELCRYAQAVAPHSNRIAPVSGTPARYEVSSSADTHTKNLGHSEKQPQTGEELGVHGSLEDTLFETGLYQPAISGTKDELGVQKLSDKDYDSFDPRKNQMLLLMPRGTFKSSVVTIGFSLQMILNDPDVRILIDSETFAKAKAFMAEIKGHLEGNEAFRAVYHTLYGSYPDAKKRDQLWSDSQLNISARKRQRKEATISCGGVDVTKNGMHYDLIIMDDLHSELNTQNKEQIDKVVSHYKLAYSLLDPGCPLIVIGTRWDYGDVYQHILDNEADNFNLLVRKAYNRDGSLFFPERLTEEFLQKTKKTQGSYIFSCNPAGSKITMADWSKKNIEDIEVGDMVVGWGAGERHKKTRLQSSKVLHIGNRTSQIVKVTLASGKTFECTPDHHWYLDPSGVGKSKYLPAQVGRKLMLLPIIDDMEHDDWLGGIYDGEGSSALGGPIRIAQSKTHNPEVCRAIEERLTEHEFKWGYSGDAYWVNGGLQEKVRFLKLANPIKKQKIIDSTYIPDFIKSKDEVVSIEPAGEAIVYSMQTETGNYICHEILSRNCQYMNEPVDDETATFKISSFVHKPWELVKDKPMNWYLSVDPSYGGPYSDYAALVIGGMDHQRDLYVRHILRKKMTYSGIIEAMFDLHNRFEPRTIVIETIAAQKSIMYELNNEQKRRGTWLPITEIRSRSKSKEERIRALAPFYEFGHIFHIKECPQLEELEDELIHFPKGQNDDIIDALATILEVAKPSGSVSNSTRREKRRGLYDALTKPRSPLTGV